MSETPPLRVVPEPDNRGTNGRPAPDSIHRSHSRFAFRLADRAASQLLHVPGLGWHHWDGQRWTPDHGDACAVRAVVDTVADAWIEARTLSPARRADLRNDAKQCDTYAGTRGVLGLAAARPALHATTDELDNDPWLLNTAAGTLNLQTRTLRPCDPRDRITRITGCPYQPEAPSAIWEEFLASVQPDPDVREYLQRLIGLALVGKVIRHVLPILTGAGRNGKGTFIRTVSAALGDYAIEAEPDIFMIRDRAHPTGILDLRGARLITCQETSDGGRLDTANVKRITGGDTLRGRRMRQDFVEFTPSHLPILITNHLPKVPADDPALWARLRVIPFGQSFIGREDDTLEDRLRDDLPAVLTWAVNGLADFHTRGLAEPPAVNAATGHYQHTNDELAQFIDQRCQLGPDQQTNARQLWAAWQRWSRDRHTDPGTARTLKAALTDRGISARRTNTANIFAGIGLPEP